MRRMGWMILGSLVSAFCVVLVAQAQDASRKRNLPKRAEPPKWSAGDRGVFFKDAREKLVGERPDFGKQRQNATSPQGPNSISKGEGPSGGEASENGFAWSHLISAETIEDEVKAQKTFLVETVTTPTNFKGGDYRECRTSFSTLATIFGIAAEFDQSVRWKKESSGLRDLFSRAGANCKVGTDQSYAESKLRKLDLEELVRGGRFDIPKPRADWKWSDVADRPPLMQRMEIAQKERLSPWLANKGEFLKNKESIAHEAQILAALAEIIQREDYEYWDDDTYLDYSKQLSKAAQEIVEAVEKDDYASARKSAGDMTKSCNACHEDYRS